ncbi:hypothetical protein [Streptomyces niveus]|uniref:hypothetical protein n=1 Tax=Streptomyces niveus TaxID=193462 RepID=UPI001F33B2D0|nr:hypothetical protein [Streptomyces niveus]
MYVVEREGLHRPVGLVKRFPYDGIAAGSIQHEVLRRVYVRLRGVGREQGKAAACCGGGYSCAGTEERATAYGIHSTGLGISAQVHHPIWSFGRFY